MTEHTSATVASIAAKGLRSPAALTVAEIRTVCASALTRRPAMNGREFDAWVKTLKPHHLEQVMEAVERSKS